jgi:hypothetical protein
MIFADGIVVQMPSSGKSLGLVRDIHYYLGSSSHKLLFRIGSTL